VKRLTQSRGYAVVRGIIGVFFVGFGILIAVQILMKVGLRLEALPGVALGAAMIALGIVRIRMALAAAKAKPAP
jgi:hypothetical protein